MTRDERQARWAALSLVDAGEAAEISEIVLRLLLRDELVTVSLTPKGERLLEAGGASPARRSR